MLPAFMLTNISPELRGIYSRLQFARPYKEDGSYAFVHRGPGVYIIYKKYTVNFPPVCVYVGYSGSDLTKTLYRHFQKWNDNRKFGQVPRVIYTDRENIYIAWLTTNTDAEAFDIETRLIHELNPVDNSDYKELSEAARGRYPQETEAPAGEGWKPFITDDFSF